MRQRTTFLFIIMSLMVVCLFIADILVGSVHIPLSDVLGVFSGSTQEAATRSIILDIRLLKAVMAVLAGIALSISGLQMQNIFHNPLAGPYVLGVSSGASLGVALFLLGAPLLGLGSTSAAYSIGTAGFAWLGSSAVLLVVLTLSHRIKDIMVILILGMMFSSAVSAIVEILQYLSDEASLKSYVVWTMGSLGEVTLRQIWVIFPVITLGMILSVLAIKPMNMLLLGEKYAQTMGLNLKRSRYLIFFSTILLSGTVTAFCGPIGFIGLAVPHLTRLIFRVADHRILVPATMLCGATVLLICDILSRMMVLPINTMTALMGIPIVVYIVTSNSRIVK